jgi:hypothetical protein
MYGARSIQHKYKELNIDLYFFTTTIPSLKIYEKILFLPLKIVQDMLEHEIKRKTKVMTSRHNL